MGMNGLDIHICTTAGTHLLHTHTFSTFDFGHQKIHMFERRFFPGEVNFLFYIYPILARAVGGVGSTGRG